MAVPKKRTSSTRRDKRRTHKKASLKQYVTCPECGENALPHRICEHCGSYGGRVVIQQEEESFE